MLIHNMMTDGICTYASALHTLQTTSYVVTVVTVVTVIGRQQTGYPIIEALSVIYRYDVLMTTYDVLMTTACRRTDA